MQNTLQHHCYMKVSESEYQRGLTKDKRVQLATRNFQEKLHTYMDMIVYYLGTHVHDL